MLLFLVMAGNSALFRFSHSYSSRPFLCTLGICNPYITVLYGICSPYITILYVHQNTLHRDMLRIPLTNHASENQRSTMYVKSMRLGQAKLIVSFSFSSVRTLTVCRSSCHLVGEVLTTIVGKNETRLPGLENFSPQSMTRSYP